MNYFPRCSPEFEKKRIGFKRSLRNGWLNLLRNKFLSIATMLVIALIFFVFNVILAFSFATDSVIDKIGEKIDISAEILPDVEDYTIQTLLETVRKHPNIRDVIYVSKEEALKRFGTKYPNVIAFLSHNELENPLPNVVRIVSDDLSNNNAIITYLEQPQFSRIINQEKLLKNQEQKTRNEKILDITHFIKQIGIWLNVIFALVAILILFNSININIHAHQKEIHIMQLVGANHRFIRGGFLFEGVIYAVLALLISLFFSQFVVQYLTTNLLTVIQNESVLVGLNAVLFHFQDRLWITLIWQFLAAIFLGLLSSYLAIQLYLKKRTLF
ncbi:hypothetical protein COY07_04210 [Candidatus Peregrinibacteria bacterium CG_4_10_14_0_2_um_filter_43_11]|nr:MAG: hypothetical protein COY07_04210 [Candidatus Peregrinibacteria bacterium CG_4_10_14_0_2_um_filter_43_11]